MNLLSSNACRKVEKKFQEVKIQILKMDLKEKIQKKDFKGKKIGAQRSRYPTQPGRLQEVEKDSQRIKAKRK